MPAFDFDIVVIGAGAAGLTALAELDRDGHRVLCIEARSRIGGRIFTVHDPLCPLPIELGAEFIHGRPSEIWRLIHSASLPVYDCADDSVRIKDGVVQSREDAWEPANHLMRNMHKAASQGPDESFSEFLKRSAGSTEAKELSTSFVEGFNAAHKEIIGIASLAKDGEAADRIDGGRSFRFVSGYDSIPLHIFRSIEKGTSKLRLNTAVTHVAWRPGSVTLTTICAVTGSISQISARRVLVTVPLGVLQAGPELPGAIGWSPVPEDTLEAAKALAFGQVARIIFRFRQPFWEEIAEFSDAGFLLSNEQVFPTWWTALAVRAPILTGWSAGPHANVLLGKAHTDVTQQALRSLARILNTAEEGIQSSLEQVYFHDWHADHHFRGAYSYVPAGALAAREKLAEPVADTLYFAGEAIELNGHSATVHGAIASGLRTAQQIIESAQ